MSQILLTCAATWFYSGRFPKAPGTAGSLAAVPVGWLVLAFAGLPVLIACTLAVFVLGVIVADRYSHMIGIHDAGEIVIDEVVGQWMCLMVVPLGHGIGPDLAWVIAAFVMFRLFDIIKPWPIRWIDRRINGGIGIMLDDVLAGVFGMIVLYGLRLAFGM